MVERDRQRDRRWRTLDQLDDWLRIPMLLLSVAWLLIVVIELTAGESRLLETAGTAIWIIFIIEFAIRLTLAPDKSEFFKREWLTIIALIVPALRLVRVLAVFRAARALRGFRLVRIVGTANRSMNALRSMLHRRQFGYVALLTLLVVTLGAAGMFNFESADEVDGGFRSYWHALWWTGMLVASIGTSFWPVTIEGRMLSTLLALYGLAVFGYITATFASFFIGRDAEELPLPRAERAELAAIEQELRQMRVAIEAIQRGLASGRSADR